MSFIAKSGDLKKFIQKDLTKSGMCAIDGKRWGKVVKFSAAQRAKAAFWGKSGKLR